MQVFFRGGVGEELVVDLGADVGAVEGVYPKDLAGGGLAGRDGLAGLVQAGGLHYFDWMVGGAGEDFYCQILGKVVGATGVLAGEVGTVVLTHDGLAVDRD